MGVRAKRSHAGPAVGGGGDFIRGGAGVLVGVQAKIGTTSPNRGTTGRFRTRAGRTRVNWSVWGGQLAQIVDRASRSTGLDKIGRASCRERV